MGRKIYFAGLLIGLLLSSCAVKNSSSGFLSFFESGSDRSETESSSSKGSSSISSASSNSHSASVSGESSSLLSASSTIQSSSLSGESSSSANETGSEYSVSSFSSLPDRWELFGKSDTSYTETSYNGGVMRISHTNPSVTEAKYYGALYRIATDREYTDFNFEIKLKMTDPQSDSRWLGIMYHTQTEGAFLTGYMANFRYNGNSASSAVTANPTAFKDDSPTVAPEKFSDGNYHTIKIEMNGNNVSHYIDSSLIKSWDVTSKDSLFEKTLRHGGFALIVNRSTVSIEHVKIDGTLYDGNEEETVITDNTLASTYSAKTGLTNEPTVICDIKNETVFDRIIAAGSGGIRPSNVILHLDSSCFVTDEDGKPFLSFEEAYSALNHHAIPIAYLKDMHAANAFIDFMQTKIDILDIAVMSDDASLIKSVRTALPKIRGIVSFSQTSIVNLYDEIVKPTNESYATVAVIKESIASYANVSYIQSRFLTVWVEAEQEDLLNIYQCVNSGAYGIIASDFASIFNALENYPENSYSRTIFNVAHRGLNGYNENSVSGTKAAIEAGATHIELDGKLTKDGHIVMIHDSDVSRVTNGTGKIEDMTLNQAKELSLDLFEEEKIPTLEEIIEAIGTAEIVLIFELKTNDLNLVDALKSVLDAFDFYDRIVVISFHENSLAKMKELLPEVATADLNPVSSATFASYLGTLCSLNTVLDNEWDYAWDYEHERGWVFNELFLRDRGIVGWYYTFENIEDIEKVAKGGFVGITSNIAESYSDKVKFLSPSEKTINDLTVGDAISLTATLYSGKTTELEGKVFYIRDLGTRYAVFASAETEENYVLYTQMFYIPK